MNIRDERQYLVADWVQRCFGTHNDAAERGRRLFEEAAEALQSVGVGEDMAHQIVAYVYAKPMGNPVQEIGGVGTCLLAFAHACNCSADDAERVELRRVLSKPLDHFRQRGAVKAEAGIEGGTMQASPYRRD